ncbi:hypothetical protein Dgeo_2625 (plasmid) [Deinococcus geothermalis DSM 11300]|uniref:Uncharacterized protein n=1 Tax=Deinococcus geothermalis (strain DSM 11300 / CIP 105573 / AG-3a) TaxID=319795 RepID=Q1J375_DEIGD|nr:hypothetical protein Dgeo_2625 [Deinococcus geothermalis DSM 11300]
MPATRKDDFSRQFLSVRSISKITAPASGKVYTSPCMFLPLNCGLASGRQPWVVMKAALPSCVRGTRPEQALCCVLFKRAASGLGGTDLPVVVMIADAAQHAPAGNDAFIPVGILLVATWRWFPNGRRGPVALFGCPVQPSPPLIQCFQRAQRGAGHLHG